MPASDPQRAGAIGRRPTRLVACVAGALVLGVFVAAQAAYLRPPLAWDPFTYVERARDFPDIPSDHWSFRVGLLLPLRALQALFGYSEVAYYVLPLASGVALVLSTWWLGRRLVSEAVGVGAAVILTLSVPFLRVSSAPLPDQLAAALFTTALCLVLHVVERPAPWARHEHAVLLAAGALLGWAYLAREFVPLLYVVVVVMFSLWRAPWRELRWVAAPCVGLLAAELVLNTAIHGGPLARLFDAGGHGGQRDYITDSRLDALVRLPRALEALPAGPALTLLTCLAPLAVFARARGLRVLGVWFLALWIPLTLGTGLLMPSFRFIRADSLRYWTLLLPAALLGGLGVAQVAITTVAARRPTAKQGVIAALCVLVLAGTVARYEARGLPEQTEFRHHGNEGFDELRRWLETDGQAVDVLWTDSATARVLPLYTRSPTGKRLWSGTIRTFETDGVFIDEAEVDRGAVVIYSPGYSLVPMTWFDLPRSIRSRDPVLIVPDRSLRVVLVE